MFSLVVVGDVTVEVTVLVLLVGVVEFVEVIVVLLFVVTVVVDVFLFYIGVVALMNTSESVLLLVVEEDATGDVLAVAFVLLGFVETGVSNVTSVVVVVAVTFEGELVSVVVVGVVGVTVLVGVIVVED